MASHCSSRLWRLFEDLLRGCLERICRLTGWSAGHVYLPDNINDPRQLLPIPVWHFEREELAPLAHETAGGVLVFDEGLHGKKWATRWLEGLPNISHSANEPSKPILLKHGFTLPSAFRCTQRESFRPCWSSSRLRANCLTSIFSISWKASESSLGGLSSANGVSRTTRAGGSFRYPQSHDHPLGGVRGNAEYAHLWCLSHGPQWPNRLHEPCR